MLFDIARFNVSAVRVFGEDEDISISEYLDREGYSPQFKDDFLLVCSLSHPRLFGRFKFVVDLLQPMTAAIWSTPPGVCANDFLAKGLIRFLYNHNSCDSLEGLHGGPSKVAGEECLHRRRLILIFFLQ